eukprot:gb/GFBE01078761.1/.p1 GENE.gb/GFBE01078761.1/~~gb/GFBE01078761.1/.p1  ORF type:complete len:386 (+),score=79.19 gb/GFBE01078761.1/:1-1158(+)
MAHRSLAVRCGSLAAALLGASSLQGCGSSGDKPSPAPSPAPTPAPPAPPARVPTVTLRSGAQMPVISAGVWQFDDAQAEASVVAAIASGFSHIDTAYNYFNQKGVGRGIKKSGKARESLFVTTKVPGCGANNVSAMSAEECRRDTAATVQEDLALLNLSYVDLVLLHFPPCFGENGSAHSPGQLKCYPGKTGCTDPNTCALVKAQWNALTEAYEKKQVRSIGVSNYCSACFQCLEGANAANGTSTVMPMVNQVQYHAGMGSDPQGMRTYAEKHGMVLQAWSPLGSGGHGSDELLKGNLTTSIGKKYGKSSVQIALKWIVSHNVTVATKSSNPDHLKADLEIFDFELDDKDLHALDAADFAAKDTPSFLCSDQPTRPAALAAQLVV